MFIAYWQGFTQSGTGPEDSPPLHSTPRCVDIVALAFALPAPGSQISTAFLTSKNSEASILADARVLQARGQKVIVSINGSPDMPWEELDPATFAASVRSLADAWQLDGVDLDNESPDVFPGAVFIATIKAIRALMGPAFIISYPAFLTFRDGFLTKVKDELSYVATMAYWNGYEGQVALFNSYAEMVGAEKVAMGVKPGTDGGNQSTPFEDVPAIARYEPEGGQKAGMMLYSLSIDTPPYTKKPTFTWTEAIHAAQARA